jgi:hypothetical protein
LCQIAIQASNVEQLLMILYEIWSRGAQPNIAIITHAIRLCCDASLPRLARDVAEQYESQVGHGSGVPDAAWVRILMSSADNSFVSEHMYTGLII